MVNTHSLNGTRQAGQGHLQGLDGEPGFQRLTHAPADDLLRVIVRHDGEVAEVVLTTPEVQSDGHVGNVAHPQLVGTKRDELPHEVRVQRQVVPGVRRPDAVLAFAHLQVVPVDDVIVAVVA